MSIASELQNYADGLDNAYDAAQDMGATIPVDRNMDNLDDAIRTIPVSSPNDGVLTITQNGTTIQTFSADQATNVTAALTDTTYSDFAGATSSVAGTAGLVPAPTTADPDKYLKGDGSWGTPTGTTYTAGTNVSIDAQNVISATDTTYSDFTGATASVAGAHGLVPAPAAGDEAKALHGDGTWKDTTAKLVEMAYGEANAWAKFIAAYNAGSIVYCRASSNADPSSGAKTRKAFMAYVNNETNPTSVEFQYVRSVSSKTDSQQCDQVFVYTLKNTSGGQWSVASRNMAPKINVDSTLTKTFSNGANATVTLKANVMTGATSSVAGTAGYVPAPTTADVDNFLKGDGTWATAGGGKDVTLIISDLSPQQSWPNAYSDIMSSDPQAGQQYSQMLNGMFDGQGNGFFAFLDENGNHYLTIDELTNYFQGGYNIHIANGLNQYGGSSAPMYGADICGLMLNYSGSNNQYMLLSFQSDNSSSVLGLIKAQCMIRASMDYGLYYGVIN